LCFSFYVAFCPKILILFFWFSFMQFCMMYIDVTLTMPEISLMELISNFNLKRS